MPESENSSKEVLWNDRKRTFLGLPWSFTRYQLTGEKFILETGFFSRKTDEVRLYRIRDVSLSRKLGERIFGLGTIAIASSDRTLGDFEIKRVKHSKAVAEVLSDLVEENRLRNRVGTREILETFDQEDTF